MVQSRAHRLKLLLAFGAIYIIWGSTYLAIRYGIESFPPFRMMGVRSLIAGALLYLWGRLESGERLTAGQWRSSALLGALFFLCGHGFLASAERRIPSGVASLLVATIPVWISLFEVSLGKGRLSSRLLFGLSLGFGGVLLLAEPAELLPGQSIDLIGTTMVLLGSVCWAVGTILYRRMDAPRSAILFSGANLLCGGSFLLLVSVITGEVAPGSGISARSVLAVLYLIVFGTLVGFVAYVWLLRVERASKVATYAFVNPVIAVLLGWIGGGEELSARILLATALMVAGVAILVTQKERTVVDDRAFMARTDASRESG